MELTIEVVGFKAFKDFVQGEAINSGVLYSRVKLDERYNKPGINLKAGITTEEWKMPNADTVFAMQRIPLPFMAVLKLSAFLMARKRKKSVLSARPHENSLKQKAAQ